MTSYNKLHYEFNGHRDLQAIRGIMREEVPAIIRDEVSPMVREIIQEEVPPMIHKEMSLQLGPVHVRLRDIDDRLIGVEGRMEVVKNDVKEIYFMLAKSIVAN